MQYVFEEKITSKKANISGTMAENAIEPLMSKIRFRPVTFVLQIVNQRRIFFHSEIKMQ